MKRFKATSLGNPRGYQTKQLAPVPLDKWFGDIFTDTTDPTPPQDVVPAPEQPFGSPEPLTYLSR